MTPKEAFEIVREHARENQWSYDSGDQGGGGEPSNFCASCGWCTLRDQKNWADGLDHKPGCKLAEALKITERFLDYATEDVNGSLIVPPKG